MLVGVDHFAESAAHNFDFGEALRDQLDHGEERGGVELGVLLDLQIAQSRAAVSVGVRNQCQVGHDRATDR